MTLPLAHNSSPSRFRPETVDIFARVLCVTFYSYFVFRAFNVFLDAFSLTVTLLLIAESLAVLLIITARFPKSVKRSPYTATITIAASFYFIVISLSDGIRLAPVVLTAIIQMSGILLQILAKLYLGRSFALMPANRGVVTTGPYRLVRHPIYLGYFISHVGFLLSMWSLYNLGVYTLLYTLQFLRIREEEKLLSEDEEYRQYTKKVRYRFIPVII
ncbi:MAG: isoprenylcysteine carboxylmethyltransferase family protein [Phycisphaerales bacterium]|nr:MAG: isoprenylcysteine carboxylmethyltransferase family protein [Phycisphaerales bacterium]